MLCCSSLLPSFRIEQMGKKVAWRVSQTDVDDQVTGVVSLELRKPLKIT